MKLPKQYIILIEWIIPKDGKGKNTFFKFHII